MQNSQRVNWVFPQQSQGAGAVQGTRWLQLTRKAGQSSPSASDECGGIAAAVSQWSSAVLGAVLEMS